MDLGSESGGGSQFRETIRARAVDFVDAPVQRRGIGTERLGFQITHEDDRKFYMKRDPKVPIHISN
jgi:hypothetical protein